MKSLWGKYVGSFVRFDCVLCTPLSAVRKHLSYLQVFSSCKLLVSFKTINRMHNVFIVARALQTSSKTSHPHCSLHRNNIIGHHSLNAYIAASLQDTEASTQTSSLHRRTSKSHHRHCSLNTDIVASPQSIEITSQTLQPYRRTPQPHCRHRPRNDRRAGGLVSKSLSTVRRDAIWKQACPFKHGRKLRKPQMWFPKFSFSKVTSPVPTTTRSRTLFHDCPS